MFYKTGLARLDHEMARVHIHHLNMIPKILDTNLLFCKFLSNLFFQT